MSQVRIAARPTRLVSLRSPSHPPHKGEGDGSHGFAASRARAGEGGEGAERRASARHRGSHGPFRRRLTLRVVVLPQARDAQGCSPFCPGLSPPGLSGRLELLPTNGRARTPAHARNGGLRPLRLIPLDHSPSPHRAGTRRPPPRRGRDEYGRGWGEGDKSWSIPPFSVSPANAGAHTGQGLERVHGSRPSPGSRWIDRLGDCFAKRSCPSTASAGVKGQVRALRPNQSPPPRSSSRKRGPRSSDAAAHRGDWRTQRPP
jgi:hypothetical protein